MKLHDSQRTAVADAGVADADRLAARRTATVGRLGLPRVFFRGRRVLQIGGAAEAALQYSLWGADVTLVATDPALADFAERMFVRHRRPLRIEPERVLLADPAGMAAFEFVACEEPLLYSEDPLRDLDILLANLARDGVILVAVPEAQGWRRRIAMQRVVRMLAHGRDEMAKRAHEWFHDHVAATARERGHAYATALADVFVDQVGRPVELSDLFNVFAARGMTGLAAWPSLDLAAGGADAFDYLRHRARYQAVERSFAAPSPDELAALEGIERRVRERNVDDALLGELREHGGVDRLFVLAAKQ